MYDKEENKRCVIAVRRRSAAEATLNFIFDVTRRHSKQDVN